jgi:hypothetical protein
MTVQVCFQSLLPVFNSAVKNSVENTRVPEVTKRQLTFFNALH